MENPRYKAITRSNIAGLPVWSRLEPELREAVEVVSMVLPFRTNEYVCNELIDWENLPDDPMFQLTFPQREMLDDDQFEQLRSLRDGGSKDRIERAVNRIRYELNPHPAGQMTHNRAMLNGRVLDGIQHKYRETALFFPSHGQTCHAYCTFCFRWAQFVGIEDLKFASKEIEELCAYLRAHPQITDVLFTGGDPMVMKGKILE
ncbi:MAG: hypothetical protein K8E66_13270, partial [Phycisphaerales bacterium]|nr:hypothetical protein [Phycisphaerales bacterium]